jgi:signal transduction histidine kinase/ActR/RegA family two-component response regulator
MPSNASEILGEIAWGTDLCFFHRDPRELAETLAHYFQQGLRQDACCLWVVASPLDAARARLALVSLLPDLEESLDAGRLQIVLHRPWRAGSEESTVRQTVRDWLRREPSALAQGLAGLRIAVSLATRGADARAAAIEYGVATGDLAGDRRVVTLCTYSFEGCGAGEAVEIIGRHQATLIPSGAGWAILENRPRPQAPRRQAEEDLKRLAESLEQRVAQRTLALQERTSQLQTLASQLAHAEQRERRRLARLLHDDLQQLLVAARLKVAMIRRRTVEETICGLLVQVDGLLDQAISGSRSLTFELSPPVLYEAGLEPAVKWLAGQMEEKHGLTVEVETLAQVEPVGEETRILLFHAVRELLFNVVKHASADRALVRISRAEGDLLEILVADQGAGFDPAILDQLVAKNPAAPGGFGLFSLRQRLEILGGRLDAESSFGTGTRMIIRIPLAAAGLDIDLSQEESILESGPGTGGSGIHSARRKRIRVLVADDHAILREGLSGLLAEEPDIDVVGQAGDGQEALELARRTAPQVVLMDITMPVLNGIDATRQIKAEMPQIRVIGLSMHEDQAMISAMHEAGADAYLVKNGPSEALVEAIRGRQRQPAPSSV